MKVDFNHYYDQEYKRNAEPKLYHDWVYDSVFGAIDIEPDLKRLIKIALFRTSYSCMWITEIIKLDYERYCISMAKIPVGSLKGMVISKLPNEKSYLPKLYNIITENTFVKKAINQKIQQIKFYTDE